ncbi:hypothetical protein LTR86_005850 [Recurvomyces mirabilis]|nr:hypothetical protein LTR86_005850 [Recurvomyces mirabilis]
MQVDEMLVIKMRDASAREEDAEEAKGAMYASDDVHWKVRESLRIRIVAIW